MIRNVNFNSHKEIAGSLPLTSTTWTFANLSLTAPLTRLSFYSYPRVCLHKYYIGTVGHNIRVRAVWKVSASLSARSQLKSSYQPPCCPPTDLFPVWFCNSFLFVSDYRLSHRSMRHRETDRQADRQTNDV